MKFVESLQEKAKYGKLPVKLAEVTPWAVAHIGLIGPYTVKTKARCQGYSNNVNINSNDVYGS